MRARRKSEGREERKRGGRREGAGWVKLNPLPGEVANPLFQKRFFLVSFRKADGGQEGRKGKEKNSLFSSGDAPWTSRRQ